MSERRRVVLRDLCDVVQYGYTASASSEPIGPRFLRITDIVPQLIDWAAVPFCAIELAQREKFSLRHGDIVIARTGATVGYAKRIKHPPDAVFASYLVRLRLRADVDGAFIGAVIESSDYKRFIAANAGGAAQPNANAQVLSSFSFDLPALAEQRRIASVLSAYDDLIENNTRRIANLEEMARRIYEEWFVRFRFPGHEGVRMVESEFGLVPEGWRPCAVTNVAVFKYGKGLPTKHLADDGPFPVYGASKIIGRYTEYTREGRTLIVGCRGSVGVPQITLPRCFVTNNSFTADPLHSNGLLWLYHLLQHRGLKDVVGGSAQPQITLEALSGATVLSPPDSLIDKFDVLVRPMFGLAWTLVDKNTNLRTTRDLLLPKLISGELDVSALPEPDALAA